MGSPESWNRPQSDTRGESPTFRTNSGRQPSILKQTPLHTNGHAWTHASSPAPIPPAEADQQCSTSRHTPKHSNQQTTTNNTTHKQDAPARPPEKPYTQQTKRQTNHNAKNANTTPHTRTPQTKINRAREDYTSAEDGVGRPNCTRSYIQGQHHTVEAYQRVNVRT